MLDSKPYQWLLVAGAICAVLAPLGLFSGWLMGAFNAPMSFSIANLTKDLGDARIEIKDARSEIKDARAEIKKLNDAFLPGLRDQAATYREVTQNTNDIKDIYNRLTKDEVEWARAVSNVDRLSDGTAATTRRSR